LLPSLAQVQAIAFSFRISLLTLLFPIRNGVFTPWGAYLSVPLYVCRPQLSFSGCVVRLGVSAVFRDSTLSSTVLYQFVPWYVPGGRSACLPLLSGTLCVRGRRVGTIPLVLHSLSRPIMLYSCFGKSSCMMRCFFGSTWSVSFSGPRLEPVALLGRLLPPLLVSGRPRWGGRLHRFGLPRCVCIWEARRGGTT
jgi:hypothetical protein